MVEPDRVTDDVGRKSVTLISIHHQIIDQQQLTCQYPWLDGERLLEPLQFKGTSDPC